MQQSNPSDPDDLEALGKHYGVSPDAMEDLAARRRAGARDGELINLLAQPHWGGLSRQEAAALIAQLPG
jgi:hypothetical protein